MARSVFGGAGAEALDLAEPLLLGDAPLVSGTGRGGRAPRARAREGRVDEIAQLAAGVFEIAGLGARGLTGDDETPARVQPPARQRAQARALVVGEPLDGVEVGLQDYLGCHPIDVLSSRSGRSHGPHAESVTGDADRVGDGDGLTHAAIVKRRGGRVR